MADEDVVEDNMRSLFGSDFEDSGSEYCPSEQHSSSDLEDILQEGLHVAGSSEIQEDGTARKPKKRLRNSESWARNVKKLRRAKGEEYENYMGITVPAKTPKLQFLNSFLNFHSYLVYSEIFNNTSTKPASFEAQIFQNVEDTVSSTWERSGEISAIQDIKYGFDIKAVAVSGKATFSYNSRWGENVMKSQKVTVGSKTGLEILLQPNQSVITDLYATKGSMKVQVDYVASLSGSVAVNYEGMYKDHHFWSVDINKVLDAGGLNKTVNSSEFIDFGFYVSSNMDVRDIDTDEVVSSLPLSVF